MGIDRCDDEVTPRFENEFFQVHDYISIESEPEEVEQEAKESQAVAIPCKVAEIVNEEAPPSQHPVVKDEVDSDWQKPISLIALRKKLNKAFTSKCVTECKLREWEQSLISNFVGCF